MENSHPPNNGEVAEALDHTHEVDLEPAMERSSPPIDELSSNKGVEAPDIVREQFQNAAEVIVIDADSDEDSCLVREGPVKKRRLFGNSNAKIHMYRVSGLLSPPTSNHTSPDSSFAEFDTTPVKSLCTTSEVVTEYEPPNRQQEEEHTGHCAANDLSLQLSNLLAANDACLTSFPPQHTLKPQTHAKETTQANGVARSHTLRAKRKFEANSNSSYSNSSPAETKERQIPHATSATSQKPSRDPLSEDPALIEHLLDIAEAGSSNLNLAEQRTLMPSGLQSNAPKSGSNPFARDTAEQFQTQNRHITRVQHAPASVHATSTDSDSEQQHQKAREDRLRRIQTNAYLSTSRFIQPTTATPKFWAPELKGSTKKSPPRRPNKYQPTSAHPKNHVVGLDASRPDLDIDGNETDSGSRVTLAELRKLSTRTRVPGSLEGNLRKDLEIYPPQGQVENLRTIPQSIINGDDSTLNRFIRCETLKEREKDLSIICNVYEKFAEIYATNQTTQKHSDWLNETDEFAEAVLESGRSGCRMRRRMQQIRDNLSRQLKTTELPSGSRVDQCLRRIIHKKWFDALKSERSEIDEELKIVRATLHLSHKKKETNQQLRSLPTKTHNDSSLVTKRDKRPRSGLMRRRNTSQRQSALQLALQKFTDSAADSAPVNHESDQEFELVTSHHEDSATSDEDEDEAGALSIQSQSGHCRKPASTHPSSGEETSQVREVPQSTDIGPSQSAIIPQAHDSSLLEQMIAKRQQEGHTSTLGTQQQDGDMLARMRRKYESQPSGPACIADSSSDSAPLADGQEDNASEFDDSDLEDCNDDEDCQPEVDYYDENDQPVCHRYIVKVFFSHPDVDGDTIYVLGQFLSKQKALARIPGYVLDIKEGWLGHHENPIATSWNQSTTQVDGEYEHRMSLARDPAVGCRLWIEQEKYNPSREAYERSRKVRKACRPLSMWFVDWVKTQTIGSNTATISLNDEEQSDVGSTALDMQKSAQSTQSPAFNIDSGGQDENIARADDPGNEIAAEGHERDSFSDQSLGDFDRNQSEVHDMPQASVVETVETVETRANGDHYRLFHCIADANRHAKEVFMQWFMSSLPGSQNHDFIASRDRDIEEELEAIGDRSLWARSEDLTLPNHNDSHPVNENFRVWVRQAIGQGPSN